MPGFIKCKVDGTLNIGLEVNMLVVLCQFSFYYTEDLFGFYYMVVLRAVDFVDFLFTYYEMSKVLGYLELYGTFNWL